MLRTRVKMNALFVLVLILSVIVFVYELDNNYGIVSLALEVIFDKIRFEIIYTVSTCFLFPIIRCVFLSYTD